MTRPTLHHSSNPSSISLLALPVAGRTQTCQISLIRTACSADLHFLQFRPKCHSSTHSSAKGGDNKATCTMVNQSKSRTSPRTCYRWKRQLKRAHPNHPPASTRMTNNPPNGSKDQMTHPPTAAPTPAPTAAASSASKPPLNSKSTSAMPTGTHRRTPPRLSPALPRPRRPPVPPPQTSASATLRPARINANAPTRPQANLVTPSSRARMTSPVMRIRFTMRASRRCGVICVRRRRLFPGMMR